MEKIEKDEGEKENNIEEINSLSIENAHASGDGSFARDEETLITKKAEDQQESIKKDAEQY